MPFGHLLISHSPLSVDVHHSPYLLYFGPLSDPTSDSGLQYHHFLSSLFHPHHDAHAAPCFEPGGGGSSKSHKGTRSSSSNPLKCIPNTINSQHSVINSLLARFLLLLVAFLAFLSILLAYMIASRTGHAINLIPVPGRCNSPVAGWVNQKFQAAAATCGMLQNPHQ